MRTILLTITIPAYNVADTVTTALDSIIAQQSKHTVEVLIIDDGSSDATLTICKKYIKLHKSKSTIIRIIHQSNGGHGSVINRSLAEARGKYYRVLDGDDVVDPVALTNFLNQLASLDSDLVASDYVEKNVHTGEIKKFPWDQEKIGVRLPAATIKTSLFRDIKLTEKCYYDDQEFNLMVLLTARTTSYIAEPVYIYNVGSDAQSVSTMGYQKHVKDHEKICLSLLKTFYRYEKNLSDSRRSYIFDHILIPMCYQQYYIALHITHSRADFLSFDKKLRAYPTLYRHPGVAGRRIGLHRLSKGLFI